MNWINENVQVVQDLYAAFGRGDMAGLLGLLDEDVAWHFNGGREDIPFAGHWQGHSEIVNFFSTVAMTCTVLEFAPDEVISMGDRVLSLGHERVQVKATGRTFETDWAHVITVRGGKIVILDEYYDTAVIANAFQGSQHPSLIGENY